MTNMPPEDRDDSKTRERKPVRWWLPLLLLLPALLIVYATGERGQQIPYSQFKKHLAAGEIQDCIVSPGRIVGHILAKAKPASTKESHPFPFYTLRVEDAELSKQLDAAGVDYSGSAGTGFASDVLRWVLWFGLLLLLWMWLFRRMGPLSGGAGAAMSFGKSKAKLVAAMETGVTFDDVAGCNEAKAELEEVVDFLKNPARYLKLGAKIPKGVLLVGPPGTGKTLLARAVAGEAQVPFFSISGSDFVEMFVGVGAARVRDLFEQAKKKSPCIIFVDEIDAIGRTRGVHMGTVNDEREQTLNQLLVELDGFEANSGVILLAATNRPDVLDRALLRPGRFDRQVALDTPDLEGRLAILRVHARGKPLAEQVDLRVIARTTPGFAGADLANALNEAALLTARRNGEAITQDDIERAIERLVAGPERQSHRLRDDEKRRVAFHETGHALVAHYCEHADPVHKISIVPRGHGALGWTMQLPEEEQLLLTQDELEDRLAVLLAGRASEQLSFGNSSTGAADDLERATGLARRMVCVWGMGQSAGLMRCAHEDSIYAPSGSPAMQRDCSEETARDVDREVRGILDQALANATATLEDHSAELQRVATKLLECETLDATAFEALLDAD